MGRQCVKLELEGASVKLRLTLKGQKAIQKAYPDDSVIATIMDAVDDPEAMSLVLTQALNFDGNDNKVKDGDRLYDLLVDNGYAGQEDFLNLMMDIAHNAGLVTQEDREKLGRVISKQVRSAMERMTALGEDGPADVEADTENPLMTLDG